MPCSSSVVVLAFAFGLPLREVYGQQEETSSTIPYHTAGANNKNDHPNIVRYPVHHRSLWDQLGQDIFGAAEGDQLGGTDQISLNANGTIVATGSILHAARAGIVRVYELVHTTTTPATATPTTSPEDTISASMVWQQLGDDNTPMIGDNPEDYFGTSVALAADGLTLAVGAYQITSGPIGGNGKGGYARIFSFDKSSQKWTQKGSDLLGELNDAFGKTISLSDRGNIVAVGTQELWSNNGDSNQGNQGYLKIFQFDDDITNSNGDWRQLGSDIKGKATGDYFGFSVALASDGMTVVAGGPNAASNAGYARVYQYNPVISDWSQRGGDLNGISNNDSLGMSVAISSVGNAVAILARGGRTGLGYVMVFEWNDGSAWMQKGTKISFEYGVSLAMSDDGNTLAVGADFVLSERRRRQVRLYDYNTSTGVWDQRGTAIAGDTTSSSDDDDDMFGSGLALSSDGSTIAIGARLHDDVVNGKLKENSGLVRIFDVSSFKEVDDDSSPTTTTAAPTISAEPSDTPLVPKKEPPREAKCGSIASSNGRGGLAAQAKDCSTTRSSPSNRRRRIKGR